LRTMSTFGSFDLDHMKALAAADRATPKARLPVKPPAPPGIDSLQLAQMQRSARAYDRVNVDPTSSFTESICEGIDPSKSKAQADLFESNRCGEVPSIVKKYSRSAKYDPTSSCPETGNPLEASKYWATETKDRAYCSSFKNAALPDNACTSDAYKNVPNCSTRPKTHARAAAGVVSAKAAQKSKYTSAAGDSLFHEIMSNGK